MPDDPTPESQADLPEYFCVRLEREGQAHYIFCEAVVSFDESTLFENGVKALQQMFAGFHHDGAEVAVLPPLGHPAWLLRTAAMQVGRSGPGGGG